MEKLNELEQFLADEKELLSDLAFDVANSNSEHEYAFAKGRYDAQVARVTGIQDSIDLIKIAQ